MSLATDLSEQLESSLAPFQVQSHRRNDYADHAPVITTLRPGVMRVNGPEGASEYIVTGGFAEISSRGISVLAERALPKGDVTQDHFDEMVQEARDKHAKAQDNFQNEPGPVDDAAKLLSDMVALGDHIGLTAKQ